MSFTEDLRSSPDLDHLASLKVLEATPIPFRGDREAYLRWKSELARKMEVDSYSLLVIGSAATGVSLNPRRGFQAFGQHSDLDLAVVSERHFDIAWHFLRNVGSARFDLTEETQKSILEASKRYVFQGVIPSESILKHLPFGDEWGQAIDDARAASPLDGRKLSARIYKDVDALRGRLIAGLNEARIRLLAEV